MRAPAFWDLPEPDWRARLLAPLAAGYGAVAARRLSAEPKGHADVPVICIGNPTVGGTGKTPTAIAVAGRLAALGRRPVFLSRGYGAPVREPTVVDPSRHGADEVGDEPLLLAAHAPAVVSPDRVAGARLAGTLGDVIVMDDGFQNPALAKTLSLLVVDGVQGVGNGLCLPAGPLRAPLDAQLARAGALVLVGNGAAGESIAGRAGLPVLRGRLVPEADACAALSGTHVLAFAGIGRPEKFFATLAACGAEIAGTRAFPDHHRFSTAEAAGLIAQAREIDARLVTTEKDMMRLKGAHPELAAAAETLPVRVEWNPESVAEFDQLLARALN